MLYYVVGQTYLVSCVVLEYNNKTEIVPVMGLTHSDPELGNSPWHCHIDDRFLNDVDCVYYGFIREDGHQAIPTIAIGPEFALKSGSEFIPALAHKRMCYRKFNISFPQNEICRSHLPLMAATRDKLLKEGFKLKKNCKICPHRGTCLDNIRPDKQGVIQCPSHGLIFNAKSGKIL